MYKIEAWLIFSQPMFLSTIGTSAFTSEWMEFSEGQIIFSNFTSSGNMLGRRYYPMGVFTPVYPILSKIH